MDNCRRARWMVVSLIELPSAHKVLTRYGTIGKTV